MINKVPSWSDFKYKFNSEVEQRERFEDLTRYLFCQTHGRRSGVFQYINQAGIECEPIKCGNELVSFQSKYFDRRIDSADINDSLDKTSSRYPSLTTVYVYMNLSFGQSAKPGQPKPKAQLNVEAHARNLGLRIVWITNQMILDQVAQYEWIYDIFFNNGPGLIDLAKTEIEYTTSYLRTINNEISFNEAVIRIDNNDVVYDVLNNIKPHSHFIIHGEGGTGKTALAKDILKEAPDIPICIRKAQSMDCPKTGKVLNLDEAFSLSQFFLAYENSERKIFIIDSAERLKDFEHIEVFTNLITELDKNGWSVIFTSRNIYLDELQDTLSRCCGISPALKHISEISNGQLEDLSAKFNFLLPEEDIFRDRIRNLFYLNLYLKSYNEIDRTGGVRDFLNLVQREKIEGKSSRNGIGLRRERCFLDLIRQRLDTGSYYLDKKTLDLEALQALIDAEVVSPENNGAIVFAHDIFEEWGVERIITESWRHKKDYAGFAEEVGNSFLVRRIFRRWITSISSDEIANAMLGAFDENNNAMPAIWRDEMLIAVLNSEQCLNIMESNKRLIFQGNGRNLKRMAALLHLSCRRLKDLIELENIKYPRYVPAGPGWKGLIEFLYNHKDNIPDIYNYLGILKECVCSGSSGENLRQCGILTLEVLNNYYNNRDSYIGENTRTAICEILCLASVEIKDELEILLDRIIANRWIRHNDPYFFFAEYILTNKEWNVINLCKTIPHKVLELAETFWRISDESNDEEFYYDGFTGEKEWGLSSFAGSDEYNHPWPFSAPIPYLLRFNCVTTITHLIRLINESIAIKCSSNSVSDNVLWNMYRGSSRIRVPGLLVSIHMAIEDLLLNLMAQKHIDLAKDIIGYILEAGKSLSLVAIVASAVTAYPWDLKEEALVLFKSIDYFRLDNFRLMAEHELGGQMGLLYLQNQEATQERIRSLNLPHRKQSLESICTFYQYSSSKENSKKSAIDAYRSEIFEILDEHYSEIEKTHPGDEEIKLILLYRLDRRKHDPVVRPTEKEDTVMIELRPQLPDNIKDVSQKSQEEFARVMRFGTLYAWAGAKFKGEDDSCFAEYEKNPHLLVELIKDLEKALANGETLMPMDECGRYSAAGMLVAKCSDNLSEEDVDYCISIVKERIETATANSYCAQIGDGLEECVHALHKIAELRPRNTDIVWSYIRRIMKMHESLGAYKKICDFAIESCHENGLWKSNRNMMTEVTESICKQSMSLTNAMVLLDWTTPGSSFEDVRAIVKAKALPLICECLNTDTRKKYPYFYNYNDVYRAFANFLLSLSDEVRNDFLLPLCTDPEESKYEKADELARQWGYFLNKLIFVSYQQHKYVEMMKIWEELYQPLKDRGLLKRYYVMKEYMLTPDILFNRMKEWDGLREEDLWIYKNLAKDFSDNPQVFNGIVKITDGIGSRWAKLLLNELHRMIKTSPNMNLRENERTTLFLLERILSSYILTHRKEIRNNLMQKEMLSDILTFMADRGSVNGYQLRDQIW